MQNQFLEAGIGRALHPTVGLTGNVVTDHQSYTIADGEGTECVGAHAGQNLTFYMEFGIIADDAAPEAGSMEEEISSEETAAGSVFIDRLTQDYEAYDEYDEIVIDGESSMSWAAGETLIGNYRIRNTTGVPIQVWANNAIL